MRGVASHQRNFIELKKVKRRDPMMKIWSMILFLLTPMLAHANGVGSVPEPNTVALFGIGAVGAIAIVLRNRRKK